MSWRKLEFKDFVTLQRGFDLPQTRMREGNVPVLGSNCIIGFHNEAKVQPPGVVTGRSGTLGKVQFVDQPYWPHNTALWVRDFKGNEPKYVYYKLGTLNLDRFGSGASVPTLNRNNLDNLCIEVPPPQKQREIADVLSAYDDLIENNRRRMALLEEEARLLYREWFVRLRFPGHENTRIVDGVPVGWMQKPIGELTGFLKRGISPHYDDYAEGLVINQKCIRDGRLNLNLARHQSREYDSERQIKVGDVLVNSTGEGTLGRVAQVKSPVENCTVDSHVTIVHPLPGIPIHYFGLAVMAWEPRFSTMGRGATNQTELSPTAIGKAEIMMATKILVEQFDLLVDPIYKQVTNLASQNEKLRTVRDLLLPRLMSGDLAP